MSGLPEWFLFTIFFALFISIVGLIGWRNSSRRVKATLARRANPTEAEFHALMSPDVSSAVSLFLWETALPYLEGKPWNLALHPDDSLVDDLPIADDDWSMDWPREWAEKQGFHESNLPDWPEDWSVTVRNFGRWLDMGPEQTIP